MRAAVAIALAVLVTACGETEYYTVPAKACTSHYTGNTREYQQMQCFSDGKNACAIQTWSVVTEREVETSCRYTTWHPA